MLCKKSLTVTRLAPHTKKEQVSWPTPSWLRRPDLNQRPSGLSHKALPCLPLENIVALLAWSASQFSLFSHLSTTPVSATGGGVPLRPNERSSSRHNPERKKRAGLLTYSFMVAEAGLEPTTFGLWARRATDCSTPRYFFAPLSRRLIIIVLFICFVNSFLLFFSFDMILFIYEYLYS